MAGRLSGFSFARTECKYKEKSESSEFFGNIFIPIFRSDGFRGCYGGLLRCGRREGDGFRVWTRLAERVAGSGRCISCRCRAVRCPAAGWAGGTAEGAGGAFGRNWKEQGVGWRWKRPVAVGVTGTVCGCSVSDRYMTDTNRESLVGASHATALYGRVYGRYKKKETRSGQSPRTVFPSLT